MKKLAILLGLGLLLLPEAKAGTNSLTYYYNFASVDSPQIVASVFANFGTLTAETSLPFTTLGTSYFTNVGTMSLTDGVLFDLESSVNSVLNHQPAVSFFNNGSISAFSYEGSGNFSLGGPGYLLVPYQTVGDNLEDFGSVGAAYEALAGYGSYLTINATTIVNSGSLTVDENGIMNITGQNVNLARSALRSGAPPGQTVFEPATGAGGGVFGNITMQTYGIDPEIVQVYSGLGSNQLFNAKGPTLNPASLPITGPAQVFRDVFPVTTETAPSLGTARNYAVFAWTNVIGPTNFLVQVFFLNTNNTAGDPNLTIDGGFVNNPAGNNNVGKVAIARFSLKQFDAIQQTTVSNAVFFADDLATITNAIYLTNVPFAVVRPSNWLFSWGQPSIYTGVSPGNVPSPNLAVARNLLASTNYFPGGVTNTYSAYSAIAAAQPGDAIIDAEDSGLVGTTLIGLTGVNGLVLNTGGNYVFGGGILTDPTNFPGRINITAGAMDATDLRVSAGGILSITAFDLTNNTSPHINPPLTLSAEWLDLNLGSVSKPLLMTNYVAPSLERMDGIVSGWSASWTNYENQLITTLSNDPSSGLTVTNVTTNVLTGSFFVTVMDQQFSTLKLANVLNLALHAKDADIQDNPPIEESVLLDVTNLTVSGGLVLDLQTNLDATTCPKLQSLVIPASGSVWLASGYVALGTIPTGQTNLPVVLTNFDNAGVTLNPLVGISGMSADSIAINAQLLVNSGTLTAVSGLVSLQAAVGKLDSGSSISSQGDVDIIGLDWKSQDSVIQAGTTSDGTTFPGALNISVTNNLVGTGPAGQNNWTVYGGVNLLVKPQTGDLWGTTIHSILPEFTQSTHTWAGANLGAKVAGYTNNAALGQLVLDGQEGSLFVFSGTGQNNALYVTNVTFLDQATNFAAELQINPSLVVYFADSTGVKPQVLTNAFPGQMVYLPIPGVNGVPLPTPPTNPAGTIKLLSGSTISPVVSFSALANTGYQVQFTTNLLGAWQTIYSNSVSSSQVVSVTNAPPSGSPQGFYRVLVVP